MQFYIYKYHTDHVNRFLKYLIPDELEEHDCEKIIEKYGVPNRMYIYINERDTPHYNNHYLPFKDYVIKRGLDSHFVFRNFIGSDPIIVGHTHHNIQLPPNTKIDDILLEVFNDPS